MNIFSTAISYKNITTPGFFSLSKLVYGKPHQFTHFHKMSHHNAQLDELFNVETNLRKRTDLRPKVRYERTRHLLPTVATEPSLPKHS